MMMMMICTLIFSAYSSTTLCDRRTPYRIAELFINPQNRNIQIILILKGVPKFTQALNFKKIKKKKYSAMS